MNSTQEASPVIRDATPEDAESVSSIYAPYVSDTVISFEAEPPTAEEMLTRMGRTTDRLPWLVMEDPNSQSALLGYAYATQFRSREAYRNTAESTVYVRRDVHRQGVGRALMLSLLERLRVAEFHRVIAGVTLPNEGSVGLHESLGFRQVGVFTEMGRKFDRWLDVGFWELELS